MLVGKMVTKIAGVYPVTAGFRSPRQEGMYTTLLMSTGLTFGTISALFGLSHGIVDQAQYSALVAAVIGSAVVPTLIANAFFLPRHLLPGEEPPAPSTVPTQPAREDAMISRVLLGYDGSSAPGKRATLPSNLPGATAPSCTFSRWPVLPTTERRSKPRR